MAGKINEHRLQVYPRKLRISIDYIQAITCITLPN